MIIDTVRKKIASLPPRKILFIDGTDERAIEAARRHLKEQIVQPLLLVDSAKQVLDKSLNYVIKAELLARRFDELAALYVVRRKGKETLEQAHEAIKDQHVFAMLLLELGEVDGVIGGLNAPTADILRAAFKVIGPRPGVKTISSVMIMFDKVHAYLFGDVSVIVDPTAEQLAEIGLNAAHYAKQLDWEPRVAFLSFSTLGSADHEKAKLVAKATSLFNAQKFTKMPAIGEVQFDAAFSPEVRQAKYKAPAFEGPTDVFVFPDLNSANIGYKIAQRLGGFIAAGPIIVGINKPVNDLSRGATAEDVYFTAIVTASQR